MNALPTPPANADQPVTIDAIVEIFEALSPATLHQLDRIYAPQARFTDPFNTVQGQTAIRGLFSHMYATLQLPRFEVLQRVVGSDQCVLTWNFHFQLRDAGPPHCIEGASLLTLDHSGRILSHRDYWDAAELYEKLPLLGGGLRWLRRRVAAG